MGDILGIKFEAIEFVFDLYAIHNLEERRELFEKIQIIDIIRLKRNRQESGTIKNNSGKRRR